MSTTATHRRPALKIRLLSPNNDGATVTLSRWDLLHLLYSVDHRPVDDRDRADLAGVFHRACQALR